MDVIGGNYVVGGFDSIPRVTSIISHWLGEDYAGVPRHVLDKASARGSAAEAYMAWLLSGETPTAEDWGKWNEYLAEWDADQHATQISFGLVEIQSKTPFKLVAFHEKVIGCVPSEGGKPLLYAGELDFAIDRVLDPSQPPQPETWDLKCTSKLNKKKVALQATAYSMARESAPMSDVYAENIANVVIHVTKSGFRLVELERMDEEWIQAVRKYYGQRRWQ